MASKCQYCGKWPSAWNNRSHSMRATRRWFKPNIFKKNIVQDKDWNETKVQVKICSRCYKKMSWALKI